MPDKVKQQVWACGKNDEHRSVGMGLHIMLLRPEDKDWGSVSFCAECLVETLDKLEVGRLTMTEETVVI